MQFKSMLRICLPEKFGPANPKPLPAPADGDVPKGLVEAAAELLPPTAAQISPPPPAVGCKVLLFACDEVCWLKPPLLPAIVQLDVLLGAELLPLADAHREPTPAAELFGLVLIFHALFPAAVAHGAAAAVTPELELLAAEPHAPIAGLRRPIWCCVSLATEDRSAKRLPLAPLDCPLPPNKESAT